MDIDQAATQRWEQETAQKRMETLLTTHYNGGTELDGVLAPADPLSRGIINALQNRGLGPTIEEGLPIDRKSTRLNSSHVSISYAVFCWEKKKIIPKTP